MPLFDAVCRCQISPTHIQSVAASPALFADGAPTIVETDLKFPVIIERRSHPFPFRTRQLSFSSPMILRGSVRGKVGRRGDKICEGPRGNPRAFFLPASL